MHKAVVQVCVLDEAGQILEEKRHLGASLEEGLEVVKDIKRWKAGGRYVVEAMGMNRWFVNACRAEGLDIVVADPGQLGLKKLGKKTDRRDAYELARRLRMGDVDENAKTYYPSDKEYGYRKLLRVRHELGKIRQALVNQVRAMLAAYRIESPGPDLLTRASLAKLRAYLLPVEEMTLSFQMLINSMESAEMSIRALTKRVEQCARKEPRVATAITMLPSVGAQSAMTLIYELGDVRRFHGPKAAAAYVGLVPKVTNSADKSHHGRVTKRGNRELRWILSQWAVRLMTTDPTVRRWAAPRLRRMHQNKVRITLARRLLVGVYIMLLRGEVFSLERCLAA